ncbi:MAG: DUF1249 domain-containing protein [Pseudomonadota bacterium]|nr:DUF1249 domain-containing protein [Pseudomonadota bacterium]
MQVLAPAAFLKPPEPRSFSGLMELYEANYIRFRRLCPGLDGIANHAVSTVEDALDLHLRVIDRTTFTHTVILTSYLQGDLVGFSPNPNLRIRVYHDARQAEVLDGQSRSGRDGGLHPRCRPFDAQLACRWQWNRFLYKWLGYCLYHGHDFPLKSGRFSLSTEPSAEPV